MADTNSFPFQSATTAPEEGVDALTASLELFDAAQQSAGISAQALGSIAQRLLESPQGGFFTGEPSGNFELTHAVRVGDQYFGCFALSGRPGGYTARERQHLATLAELTGRLLHQHAETVRMAQALVQTDLEFKHQAEMLDHIHDSVIAMDLAGFITHWNKGAERLFGYCAEEAVGRNILFLYADDGETDDLLMQDVFLEQGGREMDVRRRRKSGEVFWASLSLSLVRDANGDPSGLIGYLTDITERIEAAEKLRLNTRMFELSEEGMYIADNAERIVSVNPAFEKITGYTLAEVRGQTPDLLHSPRHDEKFYAERRATLQAAGSWHGEVWEQRKNGEVYPKWASISTLRNAQGKITYYFSIFTDITERKRNEERIHHLAYYDALTDLPNRALLNRLLDQALVEAKRTHLQGAVLFLDLNRFKPINDSLGHEVGDWLLREVGQRLRKTLRESDVVARMGGDEFVVGLFGIARREHAGIVAQKLIAALDRPFPYDDKELRVGASIGISVFPDDSLDATTLLSYADVAMYRAKKIAQDGYAFFNQEMNELAVTRLSIEAGLRKALANDELLLHYQPKVDIASGRIVGAEALVRWKHPERGMISPLEFIPIAEESGLIVDVGEWVLATVCAQARRWWEGGLPPLKIAVNISARQIGARLPQRVADLLQQHALPADWLELELTESMLMHNTEGVIGIMNDLHAMGIAMSLDDFGTGYSSLSYLKRFPIDTLKIDRSFIIGTPGNADDCAIAGAITSMARQLRLKVIAEGVETPAQLDFLRSIDCDEIQGYLYSRPLPADDFVALVRLGHCLAPRA